VGMEQAGAQEQGRRGDGTHDLCTILGHSL
jgi:hypothetical protein